MFLPWFLLCSLHCLLHRFLLLFDFSTGIFTDIFLTSFSSFSSSRDFFHNCYRNSSWGSFRDFEIFFGIPWFQNSFRDPCQGFYPNLPGITPRTLVESFSNISRFSPVIPPDFSEFLKCFFPKIPLLIALQIALGIHLGIFFMDSFVFFFRFPPEIPT